MPIADWGLENSGQCRKRKKTPQQCRGLNKIGGCALHGDFFSMAQYCEAAADMLSYKANKKTGD